MLATLVAVQFRPRSGEAENNLERAIEISLRAQPYSPDLLVLPEAFTVAGAYELYKELSECLPGPTVERLSQLAQELHSNVVAGSLVERVGDALFNTSVLLGRDGRMLAAYRKIHLFSYYGSREGEVFRAGDSLVVAESDIGLIGLSICFDARFPEMSRALAAKGAVIVASPAAWPYPRLEHLVLTHRIRALENQCFYAVANWVGEVGGRTYPGVSMVIDPWGSVVATAGEQEGIAVAQVELDHVRQFRNEFPLAALIRPDAYYCHDEVPARS